MKKEQTQSTVGILELRIEAELQFIRSKTTNEQGTTTSSHHMNMKSINTHQPLFI